jgi:hypothetical protein
VLLDFSGFKQLGFKPFFVVFAEIFMHQAECLVDTVITYKCRNT